MKLNNQHLCTIVLVASLLFTGFFINGCSVSSTAITASWTNEDVQSSTYDQVVVAPFITDVELNSAMENELAQSLTARDVRVNMGSNFLPEGDETPPDKEAILDHVNTSGADAILTVFIIDSESKTRYVPGSYSYAPYPTYNYYGTFWGYYDYWRPQVYDPGYYMTNHSYFLEVNLFDTETEKLIWSAQTETYDPATIQSFTEDFSRKIARQLKQDDLI